MTEPHWLVSFIVAWVPFLIFVGGIVWSGRSIAKALSSSGGKPIGQVIDECARELKRSNDLLERQAADWQKRIEALERK